MKVFAIKAYGDLCGGMAIIAAETISEAKQIANNSISVYPWKVEYDNPEDFTLLPVKYNGPVGVLDHFEYGV